MLCCLCKEREAYVHLKQFVGDEPIEANLTVRIDLCDDCAKKYEANDHDGFLMADLIAAVKKRE